MSIEINLLKQKESIPESVLKLSRILKIISLIITGIFVIASIIILGFRLFFNLNYQSLENKVNSTKKEIESFKTTEGVYLAFIQKVVGLDSVLKQRFKINQYLKKIQADKPAELSINSIKIARDSIQMQIGTLNLKSIDDFINNLQNDPDLNITSLAIDNFYQDKLGYVNADFNLVIDAEVIN